LHRRGARTTEKRFGGLKKGARPLSRIFQSLTRVVQILIYEKKENWDEEGLAIKSVFQYQFPCTFGLGSLKNTSDGFAIKWSS
jgi:hypothetical protein